MINEELYTMQEWVNKGSDILMDIIKKELINNGFNPDDPPKIEVVKDHHQSDTDCYYAIRGYERIFLCSIGPIRFFDEDTSTMSVIKFVQDIKIPARGSNGPTDHAAPVK